jgi:hypothetical protein
MNHLYGSGHFNASAASKFVIFTCLIKLKFQIRIWIFKWYYKVLIKLKLVSSSLWYF